MRAEKRWECRFLGVLEIQLNWFKLVDFSDQHAKSIYNVSQADLVATSGSGWASQTSGGLSDVRIGVQYTDIM
jgi:hypothetical protein